MPKPSWGHMPLRRSRYIQTASEFSSSRGLFHLRDVMAFHLFGEGASNALDRIQSVTHKDRREESRTCKHVHGVRSGVCSQTLASVAAAWRTESGGSAATDNAGNRRCRNQTGVVCRRFRWRKVQLSPPVAPRGGYAPPRQKQGAVDYLDPARTTTRSRVGLHQ